MNIIAQSGSIVKVVNFDKSKRKRQKRKNIEKLSTEQKWQCHKTASVNVAAKMLAAGLRERSIRMYSCSREIVAKKCSDCGHIMIEYVKRCRDRLCPICNWRLSIQRYGQMSQIMTALYNAYPEAAYSLVTLTVRNCKPESLKDQLSGMQKIWGKITPQRWFRKGVIGWARSLEITYNSVSKTFHPHYHILMMGYETAPRDVVSDWIRLCSEAGYTAVTKAQHVDDIVTHHTEGATLAKSICETFKYMVKSSDIEEMPVSVLRCFADAVKGIRLVAYGGKIKEYAKNLDIDMNKDDDESEDIKLCTKCQSKELDELIFAWSYAKLRYVVACTTDVSAADDINEELEDLPSALTQMRKLQTLAQEDIYDGEHTGG